ncbi:transposase [Methanofollis liminatans]|uniref:transposase n=1 Tax=Methanofollis liminatans TaxID=2201 RepID=UPI0012F6B063
MWPRHESNLRLDPGEPGPRGPLSCIEGRLSDTGTGVKNPTTRFLNRAMPADARRQAGAGQYERTDARTAYRNGYRNRSLKTRHAGAALQKPRFREFPSRQGFSGAISEPYLQDVSTGRIREMISMKRSGIS